MEFEVGEVIKTEKNNYLVVAIDEEGGSLHVYNIQNKSIGYASLSNARTTGQLYTGMEIIAIVPKEKVSVVELL